jgi:hypothetical protein
MTTQTKENVFSQYLFASPKEGEPSLWSLLIDLDKQFSFEVETNFTYVQLKSIELTLDQAFSSASSAPPLNGEAHHNNNPSHDIAQVKANNLIQQYVNASFMSAVSF